VKKRALGGKQLGRKRRRGRGGGWRIASGDGTGQNHGEDRGSHLIVNLELPHTQVKCEIGGVGKSLKGKFSEASRQNLAVLVYERKLGFWEHKFHRRQRYGGGGGTGGSGWLGIYRTASPIPCRSPPRGSGGGFTTPLAPPFLTAP